MPRHSRPLAATTASPSAGRRGTARRLGRPRRRAAPAAPAAAHQPRAPRLPARRGDPAPRCRGTPPTGSPRSPTLVHAVDLRRRATPAARSSGSAAAAVDPATGLLGSGRVQRRRHHPRRRRLPAALAADRMTTTSRTTAYELLRSLAYLQTADGPNAGNVVLWMQPDGTLNPSAEPVELPDPSDSGPSYWLARTHLGARRGLRGLRSDARPGVRRVPRRAAARSPVDAVDRQVLDALRRVRHVRRHAGARAG